MYSEDWHRRGGQGEAAVTDGCDGVTHGDSEHQKGSGTSTMWTWKTLSLALDRLILTAFGTFTRRC